ncbi:MAG: hypothetical protein IJV29_13025 [Butyrivibrio sp.]|nr:hypothetical protein [Butyrivibrio sp.]
MDKKKAIIVGDYFPLDNKESYETKVFAEQVNNVGIDVFLLSASWCKIDKKNFTEYELLRESEKIFFKKFYVDPIQLQQWRIDILLGLYSLALKVLEKYKIDYIFFLDEMIYYPLLLLLKKKYPLIKIYCIIGTLNYRELYDDYLYPEVINSFEDVDYIVSNTDILNEIKKEMDIASSKLLIESTFYEQMMKGKLV